MAWEVIVDNGAIANAQLNDMTEISLLKSNAILESDSSRASYSKITEPVAGAVNKTETK